MTTLGSLTISGGMTISAPPPPPPGSIQFSNPGSAASDYGAFADANDLDMGTESFTIEWWIKYNSFTQYQTPFVKGNGSNGEIVLQAFPTTGKIGVIMLDQSVVGSGESGSNLSTGVWYHYALVRNGSAVTLYRDGTSTITGTSSANLTNAQNFSIGAGVSTVTTGPGVNGYISCFRVVKGTAVYTTNFSKPTSPPTAISGTSLLLLSTSSGTVWTDSSGTGKTAIVTGGTWSSDNPFS